MTRTALAKGVCLKFIKLPCHGYVVDHPMDASIHWHGSLGKHVAETLNLHKSCQHAHVDHHVVVLVLQIMAMEYVGLIPIELV